MAEATRARPKPTPETQHFWDGTQAGELRLQRCDACANVYFPPRPFCPACASRKVSVFKASGKAQALQLRHQPSARRTGLHAALCHRHRRTRRRPAHDEQYRRLSANAGGARTRHEAGSHVRKARRQDHPSPVPSGEGLSIMRRNQVAVVGAAETTELGVIPNVSQIQLACRRRAERHRRCRTETVRHRRHRHRGGDAAADRALSRHHADLGRRHLGRRLLVHAACPPCRGGDRGRAVQDRADHACRKRQVDDRQAAPLDAAGQPQRPVRIAVRRLRPAQHVSDPGVALHEDPRHHP